MICIFTLFRPYENSKLKSPSGFCTLKCPDPISSLFCILSLFLKYCLYYIFFLDPVSWRPRSLITSWFSCSNSLDWLLIQSYNWDFLLGWVIFSHILKALVYHSLASSIDDKSSACHFSSFRGNVWFPPPEGFWIYIWHSKISQWSV